MDKQKEITSETVLKATGRQALYLWTGMLLAMTLFYTQSQIVFVKGEPIPASAFEWPLVFLGAITFLLGLFFFKNYTKARKRALESAPYSDRKQTLLIAVVYQCLLFETLGLYGVFLSVLTQNSLKAIPFVVAAYIGFAVAFPRRERLAEFFKIPFQGEVGAGFKKVEASVDEPTSST